MNNYIVFIMLGLGAGSLYALLAQGVVLAHRGSGVTNFATGAMAMYVAYTFTDLRRGLIVIPPLPNPLALVEGTAGWVGHPVRLARIPAVVKLGGPVPTWPAFAISLAIAALLGLIVHLLIFRPLRSAPPLAKTVASIGLMLLLQAFVVLRFGTENVPVPPVLPSGSLSIGKSTIPENRIYFLAVALVIMVVLAAVFRYTKLGLATRAASENERGAVLIGLSPDRLAAINWMASSMVAGTAGIMLASFSGLNPTDLVLFVIPALGAALMARFESFVLATVVGVLTGILQSLTVIWQSSYSWFLSTGAAAGIPFVIIIVGVIVRGRSLPERGSLHVVRLPASPEPKRPIRWGVVITVITAAGLIYLPFDLRGALLNTLVASILALSFVVVVGFAGQISLMQMALAGIAGLSMTRIAGDHGIPFPIAPILAVAVATVVGVIAGLPALRVRGVQLAVLTLGAAYTFENMALNNQHILRLSDSSGVPAPTLFGWNFSVNGSFPIGAKGSPNATFGLFVLFVALLAFALVIALRRSDLGRQFLAVRSNERAAASLGLSVARVKVLAFGIGAMLAGVVGVLTAYQFQGVTIGPYAAMASVSALAVAYLGGISTVSGAVIAGLLTTGGVSSRLLERFAHMGEFEPLILGLGLILTVVLNPEGIAGVLKDTVASVKGLLMPLWRSVRRRRPPGAPSGAGTHRSLDAVGSTAHSDRVTSQ